MDMIKPIYFPFTHISKPVAGCLQICFQEVVAYALSDRQANEKRKQWPDAGGSDIRVPVQMDETILDTIFSEYRSWADLHKDGLLAYLKTQRDRIPFFEDQSFSQIVKDIKTGGTASPPGGAPDTEYVEYLLQTGLFLHAAEMYDMHVEEANDNLHQFEKMEQDFITDLREKDDLLYREISDGGMAEWEDTGHYMTADRIRSWARLMVEDPISHTVYITSSSAVIDHLLERTADMRLVLESACVPESHPSSVEEEDLTDWRNRLSATLKSLMEDPEGSHPPPVDGPGSIPLPANSRQAFTFALYIIPGRAPYDYFSALSGLPHRKDRGRREDLGSAHTLIGLVDPI